MPTQRLLFRGNTRALISHTLRMLKRVQTYDTAQATVQTNTGKVANPIQISPAVKAAVSLLVSTLTAELGAKA